MSDNLIFGWYDDAAQPADDPTHNPPFNVPCLFCGERISDADVRTHSMMRPGARRSYFYRTHRTCAMRFDATVIDGIVWDMIDRIDGGGP